MKVSKRSWHYKLYIFSRQCWDWASEDGPFTFFKLLARRTPLRLDKYRPTNLCRYFWTVVATLTIGTLVLVVCAIAIGLIFLLLLPVFAYVESDFHERRVAAKKEKGPGLVAAFAQARKRKVCPLIEVVDQ